MNKFFEIWGNIWLVIFVMVVILGDILWLWYFFKCMGIRECNNRKCKYRNCCFRYKERITEEEAKRLLALIEQL